MDKANQGAPAARATRTDQKKLNEQFMRAGFNAGWAAACMSVALMFEKQGDADFAEWMRERADKPDKVEIVEDGRGVAAPSNSKEQP